MTERPYMKIVFKRDEVKELDDVIGKYFSEPTPIHYVAVMTEEEVDKELGR